MIRRWALRILLGVLLLLAMLLSMAALLLGTTTGSRWLIHRVAPVVGVQVQDIQGTLLHDLTLTDVRYRLGEQDYQAERLRLAWRPVALWWGVVSITAVEANALHIVIPASEPTPSPEQKPTWPSLAAPLPIRVEQLVLNELSLTLGENRYQLDHFRASLDYGVVSAQLTEVRLVTAASEVALEAGFALRYPYTLQAQLDWALTPPQNTHAPDDVTRLLPEMLMAPEFAGRLNVQGDVTRLEVEGGLRAPEQLALSLDWITGLGKQPEPPRLEGQVAAAEVSLSSYVSAEALAGAEVDFQTQVAGWLDDYRLELQSQLRLPETPRLDLKASVQGDLQGLQLAPLTLNMDAAEVRLSGSLGWTQGVQWEAELSAQGLDPTHWLPQWPGQIQLQAQSTGRWTEGELTMETHLEQLTGQLRALAVEARGQLNVSDECWQLADTYLAVGGNRLAVSGHYAGNTAEAESANWALDWNLVAPLLDSIDPQLHGQVQSAGRAHGQGKQVQLSFQAHAEALALGDWRLASLDVEAQEQGMEQGGTRLEARELVLPGLTLESVQLALTGGPSRHQLNAEVALDEFQQLELGLTGEWLGEAWQGEVNALTIRTAYTRAMKLVEPVALRASAQAVQLERACLQDRRDANNAVQTHVCARLDWQAAGDAVGELEVERLPLALIQNWLQSEVDFAGYLTGGGQWRQAVGEQTQMSVNLSAVDGALHYRYDEEQTDIYPLDDLTLSAQLQAEKLQASAAVSVGDYGKMSAELAADLTQRQLQAETDIHWRDLTPVEALVPDVHEIKGEVHARLQASGSMSAPDFSATAQLIDGSFYLPALAARFSELEANLQGDQQRLELVLGVSAGEGQLALQAELQDVFGQRQLQAQLTGEAARIMDTPMLKMHLSPDLHLTGNPEQWRLSGTAQVPFARAEIKTLPASATRVSDDIVVVDAEGETRQQASVLYTDITLVLGEDVSFNAAGLEARLGGRLRLTREPNRPLQALGEIDIVHGRFESYGQDLTVEAGVLAFTGPADNPGLNITATRTTEDYVAGINIGGTLQNPTSEIFARPVVSESDAMAILFTGKPLSETSSSDQSLLVSMIAKYGLNRGGSFIGGFSDDIGLDEITIKTGDNVNDSQLWLGKYITPKLYVHYAIGIFEQASSMGFSYILNDYFRVEAESGEQQSADVLFEMER